MQNLVFGNTGFPGFGGAPIFERLEEFRMIDIGGGIFGGPALLFLIGFQFNVGG